MQKDYPIDVERIYATGHSNGGGFTYLLWAARPGVFAAIAPSAAGSRELWSSRIEPVPVLHIAGESDRLVKFEGQQRTMAFVRRLNRCEDDPLEWAEGRLLYASANGAPMVSYIHDGGHRYDERASELIVRFFKEHALKR